MPHEFSNPRYIPAASDVSAGTFALLNVADAAARLVLPQPSAVGRAVRQLDDFSVWALIPGGHAAHSADWVCLFAPAAVFTLIEVANQTARWALPQLTAVGRVVRQLDYGYLCVLKPNGLASNPADWMVLVDPNAFAAADPGGGLVASALQGLRTLTRTVEEGPPVDGAFGSLTVAPGGADAASNQFIITALVTDTLHFIMYPPTSKVTSDVSFDETQRSIEVHPGTLAAMKVSGTIYADAGTAHPIPETRLLYEGEEAEHHRYSDNGTWSDINSFAQWNLGRWVLYLWDGNATYASWHSTAPADPATPDLVTTWVPDGVAHGTPVVTPLVSVAAQVVASLAAIEQEVFTAVLPEGSAGLGAVAAYPGHLISPVQGTGADFLSQECIIGEECFYKCVRKIPAKWIGPFAAEPTGT